MAEKSGGNHTIGLKYLGNFPFVKSVFFSLPIPAAAVAVMIVKKQKFLYNKN